MKTKKQKQEEYKARQKERLELLRDDPNYITDKKAKKSAIKMRKKANKAIPKKRYVPKEELQTPFYIE